MARHKKQYEVEEEEVDVTSDVTTEAEFEEALVEEAKVPVNPAHNVVSINGKNYKQWTDANGVTFTELL